MSCNSSNSLSNNWKTRQNFIGSICKIKKGRNVLIEYEVGIARCTKDGVTIVKNISTHDNRINMGIDLLKSVAHNANKFAGDGTTTSTILSASIVKNGFKYLQAGFNPILMQRGIKKGQIIIQEFLKNITQKIDYEIDFEVLRSVARVAMNYDKNLADIAAYAIHKIGPHGNIHFEPSNNYDSSIDILDGVIVCRGYSSIGYLKLTESSEVILNEPLILLIDQDVKDMDIIYPALELAKLQERAILIVAKELSDEVISQLAFNRLKNNINVN